MSIVNRMKRVVPAVACASLMALAPSAHAWEWNWGWGGKSVRGSGVMKTETRRVSGFTGISMLIPGNVEVIQGTTEGISLEGDDNILPLVETVVERGDLKIRFVEKNMSISAKALRLIVNAKTVEGLSVAGSGELHAAKLQSATLKANVAGSGDVSIATLDADALTVSIAGSGNFTAGGKVKSIETKIAGSGDLKIGKLEGNSVKVSIAGSGDATVWAKESLTVSVAGSGDVKYYGDAKVSQSVAGSGSVTRLGSVPGV